ncbi:SH3 domain-containing protein [Streptomyces sp. TRM43335]|uniref:SH3 domain-containing protein n=1 Tax=Streptomyces taklimakanensis TaxID=2569853 RepID=A0A6G2BFG0_9ACTN|nr:SH3 domain-containing protein [Streptomyces taklimakanensis]MTE20980.1 SH3 domain-containing protein [Streptomyces taklimakanensis]
MVKSKLSRLALVAAGGAVALATAAGPAIAEPPAPVADLGKSIEEAPRAEAEMRNPEMAPAEAESQATAVSDYYKGRVIARSGLNIRSKPNTHSKVLGTLPHGKVIKIECKVNSQNVDGNPRWYKLAHHDGWVAARYVANIGAAPHFCHRHGR